MPGQITDELFERIQADTAKFIRACAVLECRIPGPTRLDGFEVVQI
jgi:hypothetical protein